MISTFACSISLFQNQGCKIDKTVRKLMQELKEGGRVNVAIKPVCIFLFNDGGCNRDRISTTDISHDITNRDRHFDSSR